MIAHGSIRSLSRHFGHAWKAWIAQKLYPHSRSLSEDQVQPRSPVRQREVAISPFGVLSQNCRQRHRKRENAARKTALFSEVVLVNDLKMCPKDALRWRRDYLARGWPCRNTRRQAWSIPNLMSYCGSLNETAGCSEFEVDSGRLQRPERERWNTKGATFRMTNMLSRTTNHSCAISPS